MLKINNVELELDIFDAETAEIYENELDNIKEKSKLPEDARMSEVIKVQCNAVFDLFDNIFGEGTASEVFGERTNLMECLRAFETVVEYVSSQTEEAKKITDKYSSNRAQANRAQRRLNK
ncbi:MAG: DUF6673 family protein [Bacilli bacterium]